LGEIVRRVIGVSIGEFFAKEVAEPLGADFHIGLAADQDGRVARLIPPEALPIEVESGSILERTVTNSPMEAEWAHTAGWRRAEIPAANGHGNARSMAQVQSILSCDGAMAGIRFMSSAGCACVYEVQSDGVDLVLGIPVRFGMGFAVSSQGMPFQAGPRAFFCGGWGGSLVVNDPDERLTFAYAMNRMGQGTVGDQRSASLLAAMYGVLRAR
jgi:CubicO group peptidase (beta-lactamase class C family)